jgi:murein DD-endopeptidase MepM/ murein hydrolase activator NlpD
MSQIALIVISALVLLLASCARTKPTKDPVSEQAIARAKTKAPISEFCAPILSWYEDEFAINGMKRNMGGGLHNGFDMAAKIGTPVIAAAPGLVVLSGYQATSGAVVWIYHGQDMDGSQIYSYSAHLHERLVRKGGRVARGQLIGRSGDTGAGVGGEGPHLHFGVAVRKPNNYSADVESLQGTEPASPNFFLYPIGVANSMSTLPTYFPKWIARMDYGDGDWAEKNLLTGLTFPMRCDTRQ